jgi:hypothetical protein
MKVVVITQRIDCCQHCPYCWAGTECVKKVKVFNGGEEKISQTDVQAWCPLPDEKEGEE